MLFSLNVGLLYLDIAIGRFAIECSPRFVFIGIKDYAEASWSCETGWTMEGPATFAAAQN